MTAGQRTGHLAAIEVGQHVRCDLHCIHSFLVHRRLFV